MSQTMVSMSNRAQIAQGLQLLISQVVNPQTGQPLFQAVQLGAFFAPQVYNSWCEIAFFEGKSAPAGSGGNRIGWRIEDAITFSLTSGWDYEADASLAMLNMLNAQDVLLPMLHSHVTIPAPNNPSMPIGSVWNMVEEQPDRSVPVRLPNNRVYLLWHVFILIQQQYTVLLQSP